MSFLNQLKSQASAKQNQQAQVLQDLQKNTQETEFACQVVSRYFRDLAKQLDILQPPGPAFSIDGKNPWPAMKLTEFSADARKKMLRDKEVHDYIAMGWNIVPQSGAPVPGRVSVNFPPDLERVQKRLQFGQVEYERKDQRHPEKNTLQAIVFEFKTQARGNVTVTPDHDRAKLTFRIANVNGFGLGTVSLGAAEISGVLLDELAKMVVAQPSTFPCMM